MRIAALFLAEDSKGVAGRIAAIVNHRHNQHHNSNVGFFGYFECRHEKAVAHALLKRAAEALAEKGVNAIMGPASPSSNGEFGLLVDGFDRYPALIMPFHKDYYRELIESFGFAKAKDLLAFEVHQDRLNRDRLGDDRAAGETASPGM